MVFDSDTDFDGLVMRVGGVTVAEWGELKMSDAPTLFGERLVEWNWVDDDGDPVPASPEGVGSLDAGDVRTLVRLWLDHVAEVRPKFPLLAAAAVNGHAPPADPGFEAGIPTGPPSSTEDT